MSRPWLLVALTLLCAIAGAQSKKITVEFPDQGDRVVYLQSNDKIHAAPESPRTANGKSIDLETSADGQNISVVVVDRKLGSAATKPFADAVKAGTWKLAASDFTKVGQAAFVVLSQEQPVASGVLHVKGKGLDTSALLTSADKGRLELYVLDPGDFKATFEYKVAGQTKTLPEQTFEVKTGQSKPAEFVLDVPDKVEVVSLAVPTAKKPAQAASTDDEEDGGVTKSVEKAHKETPNAIASVLGTLGSMVFGLLVVGGVAYGLWWYIKNNQKQVQTVLNQAGVPVNADPADPTGAAPVAPQAPKPIEKIVLDPSAATLSPATPQAPSTAARNPRLVGDDGSLFMLSDGPNQVGREAGLSVAIVGESSVSRNHATLTVLGGQTTVTDTGSTNGTFVNGAKVMGSSPLRPGDAVQFGAKRFRYEE